MASRASDSPSGFRRSLAIVATVVGAVVVGRLGASFVAGEWSRDFASVAALAEYVARLDEIDDDAIGAAVAKLPEFGPHGVAHLAEELLSKRSARRDAAGATLVAEVDRWRDLKPEIVVPRAVALWPSIRERLDRFDPPAWYWTLVAARRAAETPALSESPATLVTLAEVVQQGAERAEEIAASAVARPRIVPNARSNSGSVPLPGNLSMIATPSPTMSLPPTDGESPAARLADRPPKSYDERLERRLPMQASLPADEGDTEGWGAELPAPHASDDWSLKDVKAWTDVELMRRLHDDSQTLVAACESELRARRYAPQHLVAARRMFDPDPGARLRLVDELPTLAGVDARRWLEQLAKDAHTEVRARANAALATASPQRRARVDDDRAPRR